MMERVADYIAEHRLLEPGDAVLVGVSGGVDSMTLLDVLRRLAYRVEVAHVNYRLRDAASDADEALVRRYADSYGIPVHVQSVDGRGLKEQPGSFQAAARAARYAFFEAITLERGLAAVAVAHHVDDQAETLLLNLFRGAGLEGLSGMPPARPLRAGAGVRLVRPLLWATREAIARYAAEAEVPWRFDVSNADTSYRRNAVRERLLPLVEEMFGAGAVGQVAAAADRLRAYRDASFDPALAAHLAAVLVDDRAERTLRIGGLRALAAVWRRRVMLEALGRWSPRTPRTSDAADRVLALLDLQTGRRVQVDAGTFWRERDALVFVPTEASPREQSGWLAPGDSLCVSAGCLSLGWPEAPPASPAEGAPNRVWIDASRVSLPLSVRPWASGDRIRPFGMAHTRKVSDMLTDARVPSHVRAGWPVVLSDRTIIWIPGVRMADEVRISAGTERALRLVLEPGSQGVAIPSSDRE
ncbi:MAG: tRNA lysidine(34) synthetase TilS [Rhodothermales bacterium]